MTPALEFSAAVFGGPLAPLGFSNLGQVLRRAADGGGGLIFLDDDGTEHRSDYARVLDEALHVLGGLNAAGLGPGDRVILPVKGVGRLVPLLWACFLGGIVAVPMAPPTLIEEGAPPVRKLHAIWGLLDRPLVVADGDIPAGLAAHAAASGWQGFRALSAEGLWQGPMPTRLPDVRPDDLAMMPQTSGSTGTPKAVMLTHANILAMVAGTIQANGFGGTDTTLNWMPLDHPGANVFLGVMPAVLGAWQVHVPTAHILTDPLRWLSLLSRHRVSISWAPNFAFSMIGRSADRLAALDLDLSSVSFLVSAGEQVAAATSATFLELLEAHGLRDGALRPAFGMAESCSGITWSRGLTRGQLAGNPTTLSLGPPIPGAAIRITDDEGHELPAGELGLLELSGPSVTQGYYDNAEANAEALKPGGWFATGDLAYIVDGELYITGRKKQIVIINGLNIPVHDIEAAAEEVAGINPSFTAAFSVFSAERGTEELVLVFNAAGDTDGGDLGRRLRAHLTRRTGLAPTHLLALPPDLIPKTNIGKIQRLDLKRRFEKGELRGYHLVAETPRPSAPRRDSRGQEALITTVWAEALGLDAVGPDDNFFELGGHSVLLIQVAGRLKQHFPVLEPVDLFRFPTVRTLAAHLRDAAEGHEAEAARTPVAPRRAHDGETEVAVIGIACRFPGADNPAEFWANLREGRESIARFTVDELVAAGFDRAAVSHADYVPASPVLKDAAGFDAAFFGYGAREAELMDPQQRLFLHCAWEALEDAGYNPFQYAGRIGAFVGASMNTYFTNNVHPNRRKLDPRDRIDVFTLDSMGGFQAMVANDKDYIATRTSYKLDLRGPSLNVQTACSTGLVVIHAAVQSLLAGDCAMALAGAAAVQSPQAAGHLWQEGMLVTADGHCRAFDAAATGTIFGSGVGAVLLKPLKAALADGDHVYAVIKGTAVNNDGGVKVGFMAPSGTGETGVVRDALAASGVPADTITFMEAHGTGTALGDPIEVASLAAGLRSSSALIPTGNCALGSVKTNVGHLQIASGIVGFIKTVLALHHRQIPPTLHFQTPNPAIDLAASPFHINTALVPWQPPAGVPRRAGVNSLGIGGTNAHAILEEAPATPRIAAANDRPSHLLTLSARTPTALAALARSYGRFLADHPDTDAADLCFTANTGRKAFEHRHALVFDTVADLRAALAPLERVAPVALVAAPRIKIAFRFADRAEPGLGRELYRTAPPFRAQLDECDRLLSRRWPALSLIRCLYGDAPWPDDAAFTRAATASLGIAVAALLRGWGLEPDGVLGTGTGATAAAGWALGGLSLEDALERAGQDIATELPPAPDGAVVVEVMADGWAGLLRDLGHVHVRGGAVDWAAFDQPYRRRRLSLPTYPFESRRYWLEPPKAAPTPVLEARPHPLLDRRFGSPLTRDTFYEGRLDTTRLPLLADHLVHGQPVVSGACYMSMLTGVAAVNGRLEVRDVAFLQALPVPEDGVTVQLALQPQADGSHAATLISLGDGDGAYRSHVTATLNPLEDSTALATLATLDLCQGGCPQTVALDDHYARLEQRHIVLGPQYRWMTALSRGTDQAFCRLRRPAELDAATDAAYGLHPGLIDACFGLMIAAVDMDVADTFIPSSIERLRLHSRPPGRPAAETLWAWGRFSRQADGGGVRGDIQLCGDDGMPVLTLAGFTGRVARREQVLGAAPALPLYRLDWQADDPPRTEAPAPGAWLVLADSAGLGTAVASRLAARGLPCRTVPAGSADLTTVLGEATASAPSGGLGILHLGNLDIDAGTAPARARALGLTPALLAAQALAAASVTGALWLVTRGAQAAGENQTVTAAQAPAWGLAKVLRLEQPSLPCRAIDLDPSAASLGAEADRLLDELAIGGQAEVALRGGRRLHPVLLPLAAVAVQAPALSPDASYLVAGGSGALGSVMVDWLADRGARHIVVASRREAVDDRQVQRLAERGVSLHPLRADLADGTALALAWRLLEPRLPPLRGLIHAAGMLDDGALSAQTPQRLDAVAAPKMEGALALAHLAEGRNLDFLVLFSSAASILGHPGQANYAAANAYMDALAADLRARGHRAVAISWGPWAEAGMAASDRVTAGFNRLGIHPLTPDQGRRALETALAANVPHVGALNCDWDRYVGQSVAQYGDGTSRTALFRRLVKPAAPVAPTAIADEADLSSRLAGAAGEARRQLLAALVLDVVTEALSFTGADAVDRTVALMDQGLDSLAAVSVRANLARALNGALPRALPVGLVFEYPTVDDLTRFLDRETAPPAPPESTARLDEDDDLDGLSLAELEALVSRELNGDMLKAGS
ncbi:type I polyketide synthase [Nitrospirillum iridis]|uniref:Acyl transferase domain-containing protein/acyl-CoA synthetase (AMP-forming)/AMP-acid ligase II/short-subunit dehydrogenase/aryl carrier-like protein n=1 Tax=Nitrospirillum iridis TaxID=765888 RepID=A0A7X0EFF5_9PROT|nr:type I polyketide synthase [Nitrospirillum iridis]MBB6254967.1 acyl transferase domain-containing protein/acyl-CoA synthetase (AMP-forming)/AMP-acid ligase II/short-subunit dehydrogenase/aryl carrier-like protein [Nitrospirillum iridis]